MTSVRIGSPDRASARSTGGRNGDGEHLALIDLEGCVRVDCSDLDRIRISRSPRLIELALTGCPDSLCLELIELPKLQRVQLPDMLRPARVFMRIRNPLRPLQFAGRVGDLHLHWLIGAKADSRFGHYGLQLPDGPASSTSNGDNKGRLSMLQLEAGAGSSRLRWRRQTDSGWSPWLQPEVSRSLSCFDALLRWLAARPQRAAELVASTRAAPTALRSSLLETVCAMDWQGIRGRKLQQQLLPALKNLVAHGADPRAIWAIRSVVNRSAGQESPPGSLRQLLRESSILWPVRRRRRLPRVMLHKDDLTLLALCRQSMSVRRLRAHSPAKLRLDHLDVLGAATEAERLGSVRRLWLAGLLGDGLACLHRKFGRRIGEDGTGLLAELLEISGEEGMPDLDRLIKRLPKIADDRCNAEFVALCVRFLAATDQVRIGIELVGKGVCQARELLLSALDGSSVLTDQERALATEALLMPVRSPGVARSRSTKRQRQFTSGLSGQCVSTV